MRKTCLLFFAKKCAEASADVRKTDRETSLHGGVFCALPLLIYLRFG